MPREQNIVTVTDDLGDEHTYSITHLPAKKGWEILCKLVGILGGAAGRALGSITPANVGKKVTELSSFLDGGIDGQGLAAVFERLSERLVDDEKLLRDLFSGVARDGKPLNDVLFDEAFAGNYGELFAALVAILKVNYGPFFRKKLGELAHSGLLAKLKDKVATSSSQNSKEAA